MKQDMKVLQERLQYFADCGWKTMTEQQFHDLVFHGKKAKRIDTYDLFILGFLFLLLLFFVFINL